MNNKKIILGIILLCASTLMISCSSSKKVGCYYSDGSVKEIPVKTDKPSQAYRIAE